MKIKEVMESYKVTQNSPQGLELTAQDGTKMVLPPEKLSAIQADPNNPNKFSMNPQAMQSTTNTTELGPKVGAEVELPPELSGSQPGANTMGSQPMGEMQDEEEMEKNDLIGSGKDGHIGGSGDPTDDLISDVEDKKFTRFARGMGNRPVNNKSVLPENDELNRWLTIANLR